MKCFLRSAVRHTHCSHHLAAIGTTTSSCCRIQEEFYVSVFWKKKIVCMRAFHTKLTARLQRNAWHSACSRHSTIQSCGFVEPRLQQPYLRIFALSLDIAATASSWVANSTSASPVTLPSGPISMCTLTGFRGEKNYTQNIERLKRTNIAQFGSTASCSLKRNTC